MKLVLDWDGTVTERDTLHMVIEQFGDLEVFRAMEEEIGRKLTLQEVIRVEVATIPVAVEEVVDWLLEHVRIRPGLARLVARHDPLIVSAGFHELIEPVLRQEGVQARVVANHVALGSEGWVPTFWREHPCPVCGEPCKRAAVGPEPFVYVGDGISDRCVSVAAKRVFARDGLARWLAEQGVPFEPFQTLDDVTDALEGCPIAPSGLVPR